MLSHDDADRIRRLKADLDQVTADHRTAEREVAAAAARLRQVRASIRPAARTRFTRWLTNSDPEELRRYRAAKEEYRDQKQLARQLEARIAEKDAHITEAVEECLARNDRPYQKLVTHQRMAREDRASCEELRAAAAQARDRVDAALKEVQRYGGRDTGEARKAADRTATRIAEEMSALKKQLTALRPRLGSYKPFPTAQIKRLRTEFSGSGAAYPARRKELTDARTALDALHRSLAATSKYIVGKGRGYGKKQRTLVQEARTRVLGS